MPRRHRERHRTDRIGWLRAAVLGANDGIVSTASLLVGVAAAGVPAATLLTTAVAGVVAGAMSMAAGEYVSVHSQADAEAADLAREQAELDSDPASEQRELQQIYVKRGLPAALALQVAQQLMAHDALGAHARDELGLSPATQARPVQAALASAASFAVGALLPTLVVVAVQAGAAGAGAAGGALSAWIAGTSLGFLAALGAVAARVGGAPAGRAAGRVTFWGALAMALTAGIGAAFGAIG
jgi:VIT1/CCC1 family predicted Fe2+/Mn2+ transporter